MLQFREREYVLSSKINRIKQANLDDALLEAPRDLVYLGSWIRAESSIGQGQSGKYDGQDLFPEQPGHERYPTHFALGPREFFFEFRAHKKTLSNLHPGTQASRLPGDSILQSRPVVVWLRIAGCAGPAERALLHQRLDDRDRH
jgi:hypothetical protein